MSKIILGDCLQVMKKIPDKSIDMILCDMPYGTTACKWDSILNLDKLWEQYKRIIKDNGAIVLFGSEPFSSYLRMSNIKDYKYDWKWDKVVGSNFVQAKNQPLRVFEDIIVFYKKIHIYNPIMVLRDESKYRVSGKCKNENNNINNLKQLENIKSGKYKYPINKIEINRLGNELNSKFVIHPTQKPIKLMEYLIKTYTNKGNLVLDNCAGSGTTGIACLNLKRNFILIEKDKKYYELMSKRIKNHIKENIDGEDNQGS